MARTIIDLTCVVSGVVGFTFGGAALTLALLNLATVKRAKAAMDDARKRYEDATARLQEFVLKELP